MTRKPIEAVTVADVVGETVRKRGSRRNRSNNGSSDSKGYDAKAEQKASRAKKKSFR